jgi:dihydropyrimidinase
MSRLLIRNGRIVTAVDDYRADILVSDGRIVAIGENLQVDAAVHDATGLLVLPGGVDVHTHLDNDTGTAHTADTFETGTKAAAFGGTTTLIDFANQPRGTSALSAYDDWRRRAEIACIDVGAHMILTDASDQTLADMKTLIERDRVTSFKVFMAYPDALMVDDGSIFKAMRIAGERGGMVCVHAENGTVIDVLVHEAIARGHTSPRYHALTRPTLMEGEATHRAIRLAELAQSPVYIVHLSAAEALDAVVEARDRGIPAYAETCPHYLFLDVSAYERPEFSEAAKYVMTPPLREVHHQHALWRGVAHDQLQVVSTDHCPYCASARTLGLKFSKELGAEGFHKIPNGAPGVETRLPLIHDGGVAKGRFSLNRFVALTSTTPAKLFGLFPRKGTIAVGSDADIVLFDPAETWTVTASRHHSRIDYSLYEGMKVTGRVKKVFLRGQLIVADDDWRGEPGMGRYLQRGSSGHPG